MDDDALVVYARGRVREGASPADVREELIHNGMDPAEAARVVLDVDPDDASVAALDWRGLRKPIAYAVLAGGVLLVLDGIPWGFVGVFAASLVVLLLADRR